MLFVNKKLAKNILITLLFIHLEHFFKEIVYIYINVTKYFNIKCHTLVFKIKIHQKYIK